MTAEAGIERGQDFAGQPFGVVSGEEVRKNGEVIPGGRVVKGIFTPHDPDLPVGKTVQLPRLDNTEVAEDSVRRERLETVLRMPVAVDKGCCLFQPGKAVHHLRLSPVTDNYQKIEIGKSIQPLHFSGGAEGDECSGRTGVLKCGRDGGEPFKKEFRGAHYFLLILSSFFPGQLG
jgi:hypothetical protein